jgi:hypothetical protein
VIPAEDINVARDVVFCRVCNIADKLSTLVGGNSLAEIDTVHPPSGAWRISTGISVEIGATHRSIGSALGALAISLFWNGITSVFVLLALSATFHHLQITVPEWFPTPKMNGEAMSSGMTIFLWIFLTPFILIGAIMIGAFLSSIAGRTVLEIRQAEGEVFVGIGPLGWRRQFNAQTVKDVRVEDSSWRNNNSQNKKQIIIETAGGRELKFGTLLREDRMKYIAAAVRKELLG